MNDTDDFSWAYDKLLWLMGTIARRMEYEARINAEELRRWK